MQAQKLAIRTQEGIVFNQTLAGPISRSLAWIIDAFCIAAAAKTVGILAALMGLLSQDLSRGVSIVIFFVLNMGYAMVLEWFWRGQTVGKRLLGLRVIDVQGLELHPGQIAMRNLLRAVDSLPLLYLVGGLAALISHSNQRLGDIAANTVVIQETAAVLQIPEDFLETVRYNSLRAYPHLVARLRQRTSAAEAAYALQALLRRNELDADARVTLFEEIARHLEQKVAFPPQAVESISNEQFVRNAVDVLFNSEHNDRFV